MSSAQPIEAGAEIPDWCMHTGEEPMPETSLHAYFTTLIVSAVRWLFRDRHDVFVTSNFAWYPEPGDSRDPDVIVVFGRADHARSSWRDFREDGTSPQVVFEIKSRSNTFGHLAAKRSWYDRHGVEEYYEYDPENGRFNVWVRSAETQHLELVPHPAGFTSPRLGLTFVLNGIALALLGPEGRLLGDYVAAELEAETQRERAETERERAETERERADAIQSELEALRVRARAAGIVLDSP
jgi:Uma2 family endonuclease